MTVTLMLLWPTFLLLGVIVFVWARFRPRHLPLAVAIGLAVAYLSGAAAGYFIGKYHTRDPVFSASTLTPPLVLPIGIVAAVLLLALARRFRSAGP